MLLINLYKAVFGCFAEINTYIIMHLWSINIFFMHLRFS